MTTRLRAACTIAALAVVLAARPFAASTLPHLHGIDEIRDWFNSNTGRVRVILLLSPT
jgi:hypothetical protein